MQSLWKLKGATLSIAGIAVASVRKIKGTAVSFLQNILSSQTRKEGVRYGQVSRLGAIFQNTIVGSAFMTCSSLGFWQPWPKALFLRYKGKGEQSSIIRRRHKLIGAVKRRPVVRIELLVILHWHLIAMMPAVPNGRDGQGPTPQRTMLHVAI